MQMTRSERCLQHLGPGMKTLWQHISLQAGLRIPMPWHRRQR